MMTAFDILVVAVFALDGFLLRAIKGGWWPFGPAQPNKGGRAAQIYAIGNAVLMALLAGAYLHDWLVGLLALPIFYAAYFAPGRWMPHNPGQQMTAWWHPLQMSAEGYVEALLPLVVVSCAVVIPWSILLLAALPGLLAGPLYLAGKHGPFVAFNRLWFAIPAWKLQGAYLFDWWTAFGERLPGLWLLGAPAALLLIYGA